jgi:hypothetical protein
MKKQENIRYTELCDSKNCMGIYETAGFYTEQTICFLRERSLGCVLGYSQSRLRGCGLKEADYKQLREDTPPPEFSSSGRQTV